MPEWITPLLWPVWWRPTPGSFSSTQRYAFGLRSRIASAVASPTIPPPPTATSKESSPPRIPSPGPPPWWEASGAIVIVEPLATVAPSAGDVIVTDGGVVSGVGDGDGDGLGS